MNFEEFLNPETMAVLAERGISAGTNIVLAIVILIAGFVVAGMVKRGVRKAVERSSRMDDTLASFFSSIAYYAVIAVVLIAVLARFGVQTASLVAALGAITLAIGFALQGTLSNIAAGVMIIAFRPYSIGDWVEVAGVSGGVKDVNLFTTILATADNKKIIIPNGQAWGDIITNYSANPTRRVDFTFSIDYSDDIGKAMEVIKSTLGADERIHKDPEIFTAVGAHGASSVDIVTRVWVDTGDYWGVHFDAMKSVKEAFDKNGISIPYPHQVNVAKKG
ncbi:MAG: mechanosensitive ion channel [Pseudomonadota bacterium]|nr:mechanosensitive ion channel [Pseudomonadota bacterium]